MELLSVSNLSQYFGAVPALKDITFTIEAGEVLGVVGQRGAGKSSLFQLLSGAYTPSSGEIHFAGERVVLKSVAQAQQLGIVAVQQYPRLVDTLDVLHNVFLGREIRSSGWFSSLPEEREMFRITRELLAFFDMPPELSAMPAPDLSDEQTQVVALARALCQPCRLLLLDDALAALNFSRQQKMLERIKELAARDVAVIMSSDDLKQIFAVTDRILVLYQGHQVAIRRTADTSPREIVEFIVGTTEQERVTPIVWAIENYYAAQKQSEELRHNLEVQDLLNQELEKKVQERTAELQEAYRQLELLDRNKTDFIKIVSHELRTPMTIFSGYSQMLLEDKTVQQLRHLNQLAATISSSSDRMREIVNTMLDLVKIDTGIMEINPKPVAVHEVLESVQRQYRDAVKDRNLTLELDDLRGLPRIEADLALLRKVFDNLVSNAIKYTPDGGKIVISGRVLEPGEYDFTKKGIEIVVSDTGIGVAPEHQTPIFEKFYQTGEVMLHSSGRTKFKGGGIGLGLAIARGVILAHRGKIWVESPGCDEETCPGSQFHIVLPQFQPPLCIKPRSN